jgi:hypothetical protein
MKPDFQFHTFLILQTNRCCFYSYLIYVKKFPCEYSAYVTKMQCKQLSKYEIEFPKGECEGEM